MMGFGLMGIGMIGGMLLFWVVVVGLAVLLVRGLFQSNQPGSRNSTGQQLTPRQILEQRYARGEIMREQYLSMLKDLQ